MLCSVTVFENLAVCQTVERYSRGGQATNDNMAHVHCTLDT